MTGLLAYRAIRERSMPPVPYGWYAVLRSGELRAGKVVSLHYFGRALIAPRGEDGQAGLRDAHCSHYGAHLGVGGAVECPFLGWRFGADGRCARPPGQSSYRHATTTVPPAAFDQRLDLDRPCLGTD